MRILITRPVEDAGPFARRLEALGHRPFSAPLLAIELSDTPPPDDIQARTAIFTSANGVRAALPHLKPGAKVFAVGPATAALLRQAGLVPSTGPGGVEGLIALIAAETLPRRERLIHVSGQEVAGDLVGALAARGYDITRWVAYRARLVEALPGGAREFLRGGGLVTAFSVRTARHLVGLLQGSGVDTRALSALGSGPAVTAALAHLPWTHLFTSAAPDEDAVIARIGEIAAEGLVGAGDAS